MIWYSGVCKCYLEYEPNEDGSLKELLLARACQFHIALDGKPELFAALCSEGKLMSLSVELLKKLDSLREVTFTFDATRNLFVSIPGTLIPKATLQAAVDSLVGSGKVTVV